MTLTLADTPTQSPRGELYLDGIAASVEAATRERRPFFCSSSRAGEFSV